MTIDILYEDEHILAVNKPAGLVVHSDGKSSVHTLADWFCGAYPASCSVGEPLISVDGSVIERPGIVHRLDKDTSGVMLLAKTQKGFLHLKEQFQNRTIEKTYHAFVYGNLKEDLVEIHAPIGRSSSNIRKWTSGKDIRNMATARDAETDVRVLARSIDEVTSEPFTFVEAKPKTGRTHQIRVHLTYIGRPLIADSLYTNRAPLLGFNRVALHAQSVAFVAADGLRHVITAPYPDDFISAIEQFEK